MPQPYLEEPGEFWLCPASEYNTNFPAACYPVDCGTEICAYKKTGGPPPGWPPALGGDQYVGFDIEIAALVPDSGSWDDYRPLGITCASTKRSDGEEHLWHGEKSYTGRYPDRMTPEENRLLAVYLLDCLKAGFPTLTWNGASFDIRTLCEECCLDKKDARFYHEWLVNLALRHFDPAWQMLTERGFMVSLKTAADGLGVVSKMEGMSGDLAPVLWQQGIEEQEKVLTYVGIDVDATVAVWEALRNDPRLTWISRSKRKNNWLPNLLTNRERSCKRLMTVNEAWIQTYPDTSWMTNPRRRGSALEWMGIVQVPMRTHQMKRKGIYWRDVDRKTRLEPYSRGLILGKEGDNYRVSFYEPLDKVLIVSPGAIDLA